MAPTITLFADGGNGNVNDVMYISGKTWVASETIDTITVGGKTTSFRVPTVDANLNWGPIPVMITQAITTVGYKDIIVTGSTTAATTFTGYWYVSEGCGFNDILRRGDLTSFEYDEGLMIVTIDEALMMYEGMLSGHLSSSEFPHTLGAYPKVAIACITDICVSLIYQRRGTTGDYKDMAETIMESVKKKIDMIRHRKIKLQKPDGTYVSGVLMAKKTDATERTFADVITPDNG